MVDRAVSSTLGKSKSDALAVPQRWAQLGAAVYLKIAVVAVAFFILFRFEIEQIVSRWLTDASWSHGFLIPLFSLYFINQHKDQILRLEYVSDPLASFLRGRKLTPLEPRQTRPNYLGLVFLIVAIGVYLFNRVSPSGYAYLRPISMIAALGSIVLFLGGWRLVKYLWLPVLFLIFAVPLPGRYYVSLTMPMRMVAAQVATVLLNLVPGMEAVARGVVIDVLYQGQRLDPPLNVAEACSGMRLLMAFLALGVAMAYLHERPLWQRLVLLASTLPIAVLCNIVRVTVTGFIYILGDPKYAQGVYHDMLGLAMLPLAFGVYGFIAWFMSSLFVEEHAVVEDVVVRRGQAG